MRISLSLRRLAGRVLLLLAVNCAHPSASSPAPQTSSASSLRPCDPGSPDSSASRLVAAEGFTFCLPSTWGLDARTATFAAERLNWGTGEPPRGAAVAIERISVPVKPGGRPPSDAEMGRLIDRKLGIQRETILIGGRRAEVVRSQNNGVFFVSVTWAQPLMWFRGEAGSNRESGEQLTIIQTVRFTP